MSKVTFATIRQGDVFKVKRGMFAGNIVRAARKYSDLVEMQIWIRDTGKWESLTSIPPESTEEFNLLEPLTIPCVLRTVEDGSLMVPRCYVDEAEHREGLDYWSEHTVEALTEDIIIWLDCGGWSYV